MEEAQTNLDTKLTSVDAQIATAKANRTKRKADPEREAKAAAAAADRDEKRAEKMRVREEKVLARSSKQVHMAKVERAAAALPILSDRAGMLFTELTGALPREQVSALAQHLMHFNRAQATVAASNTTLSLGESVVISGGDPKFIGMVGVINKINRIRCYVQVPNLDKLVYVFSSEVVPTSQSVSAEAS